MSERDKTTAAIRNLMFSDSDDPQPVIQQPAPVKKPETVDFSAYKDRTETVSTRILKSEKERFADLFKKKEGIKLAEGLKKALYFYAEQQGWNE